MARRSKKFTIDELTSVEDLGEDVKMEEVSPKQYKEALIYVILNKFTRAYKATFLEQFKLGKVKQLGNIRVGEFEFELGKTYEVPRTPEITEAIRNGLITASGKFHYRGDRAVIR